MTMRELSTQIEEASQKIAGVHDTKFLLDFTADAFERFGGAFSEAVADMELPVGFVDKWRGVVQGESPYYDKLTGERTEAGRIVWEQNRKKMHVEGV